jgi:hypothetical protein
MGLRPKGKTPGGEPTGEKVISYPIYLLDKLFSVKSRTVNDERGLKLHSQTQEKSLVEQVLNLFEAQ